MASKTPRFHPEAEQEYLTALQWYRDRSPLAALNFETSFHRAIEHIRRASHRWPRYGESLRRYILRSFPFSVIYQVLPAEILILAVAHGHRRPGYWKKRME